MTSRIVKALEAFGEWCDRVSAWCDADTARMIAARKAKYGDAGFWKRKKLAFLAGVREGKQK